MKILENKIIVSKEKEKKVKQEKSKPCVYLYILSVYLNFQVQANPSSEGEPNKKKELVSKKKLMKQ